ncbi:MAG: hypothetical protein LAO22_09585, partial [Acidobacteriia bacterium]|nr:hypothetical protein [Terriglobia bacterium]
MKALRFIPPALLAILVVLSFTQALQAQTSVTIAGSLQSELGCAGDWDPACAATFLTYDANDDVWQQSFNVPAGPYEYKAALNRTWDVNYGLHAAPGGANIPLNLAAPATVKFYFDNKSHWITDNVNSVIATVPGSFQSEIGCSGDWDPGHPGGHQGGGLERHPGDLLQGRLGRGGRHRGSAGNRGAAV